MASTVPGALVLISWLSIGAAIVCAMWVALDVIREPQQMWIMNLVWPLTALYGGPLGMWAYLRMGRPSPNRRTKEARRKGADGPGPKKPFWQSAVVATTHCGSGCTLGDLLVESAVIAAPLSLLGSRLLGTWTVDFAAAFLIGIVFQYFSIAPMRGLGPMEGLKAALKADALSLTAWQVGMYGWMALVIFVFVGHELDKSSAFFWFMMQIAMLAGFATSYPVNRWLLARGIKETM